MKAHQKLIREQMAMNPEPDEHLKREAASSFKNATVREISNVQASDIILRYEWLRNMGSTEIAFGLFFKHPLTEAEYLAGVECFGTTGGTNSHASVCGKEYAHLVKTLTRGACKPWADPVRVSKDGRVHTGAAASFLINRACNLMAQRGFHVFVGHADSAAGEEGIVFRASGWDFCGFTSPTEEFRWTGEPVEDDDGRNWKDGKWHNSRLIHSYTRNRSNRRLLRALTRHGFAEDQERKICGSRREPYIQTLTRKEQRRQMIADGFEFRMGHAKRRYVHFAGDRRTVKELRAALKWKVLPYPKRQQPVGVAEPMTPVGGYSGGVETGEPVVRNA
jgi:hypothetical protein